MEIPAFFPFAWRKNRPTQKISSQVHIYQLCDCTDDLRPALDSCTIASQLDLCDSQPQLIDLYLKDLFKKAGTTTLKEILCINLEIA